MPSRRWKYAVAGVAVVALASPASAQPLGPTVHARADTYTVRAGRTTQIGLLRGVLANDSGLPRTFVSHTNPADGTLDLGVDGGFSYTPEPGFRGTDTFTYTISDAVSLYS